MKTTVTTLLCLMAFSLSSAFAQSEYVHNQIILSFVPGTLDQEKEDAIGQFGILVEGNLSNDNELLVEIPNFSDTEDDSNNTAITVGGQPLWNVVEIIVYGNGLLAQLDGVYLNYLLTPNPDDYGAQGFGSGFGDYSALTDQCHESYQNIAGSLINPNLSENSRTIKVAILDTGVDNGNSNGFEILNQYIVKSANVLLDNDDPTVNIELEDYDQQNSNVEDEIGHGTAVAGIIAGLSVSAGLTANDVELYIIKMFGSEGTTTLYDALQAVIFAAKFCQADVINISWSYKQVSEDTESALLHEFLEAYTGDFGGMLVLGAGNNGNVVDNHFPAGMDLPQNALTVGGTECTGEQIGFSNTGNKIDINAPATGIVSPYLEGYWAVGMEGTSFSTPIVTAAIIQVWHEFYAGSQGDDVPAFGDPEYLEYNQQITSIVTTTATMYGHSVLPEHGGLVNFAAATERALTESPYLNGTGTGTGTGIGSGDDDWVELDFGGGRLVASINSGTLAEEGVRDGAKTQPITPFSLSIYPNPIQQMIHGDMGIKNIEGDVVIELSTLLGEKVLSQKLATPNGQFSIPLPLSLAAGCYFLTMAYDGQVATTRIIKN